MMEIGNISTTVVDVAIIGGGPAGGAAAITAAKEGLSVVLFEALPFPRFRPGEALHPGVEPLLRQLGVWDDVLASGPMRHYGHEVEGIDGVQFFAFGGSQETPWTGLQINRAVLDRLLLQRAAVMSVDVVQPARAKIITNDGRIVGVQQNGSFQPAAYVIDASGGAQAARRSLYLATHYLSPQLVANYGYHAVDEGEALSEPRLSVDRRGWRWQAKVEKGRIQWVEMSFRRREAPARSRSPDHRSADVTWRLLPTPAGPGYFVAGDAAATLDPACSHGVLRALMSGIYASHLIARITRKELAEASAHAAYASWLERWIRHDAEQLEGFYNAHGGSVHR
jgi:flavin-dependent dehydrogenase